MVLLYIGDVVDLVIVMALYCCDVVILYGFLPFPPELYTFVATFHNLPLFALILSVFALSLSLILYLALHVFVLVWHFVSLTLHSFSVILVLNPHIFDLLL